MDTKYFEIDGSGRIHPIDFDTAIKGWRAGSGAVWMDVEGASVAEQRQLLGELGFDSETLDSIFEPGHAARVLPLEASVYVEIPLKIAEQTDEISSLSFVCLDRLVVTLRDDPLPHVGSAAGHIATQIALRYPSTSALVCALLLWLSVEARRGSMDLRNKANRLATQMDSDVDSVAIGDILELKRQTLALDAIIDERLPILEVLEAIDRPFLSFVRLQDDLKLAVSNTASTARRIDRLDRRAHDLQQQHDTHQQDKTNRRLGFLTIISAIFLPLTLLAGIYGMNFDNMPELHHELSYFVVLLAMALIGVGMFWWFRSRGWMD